ncbi:S-adenosyl-L-methionine-dependent methyltransferase [Mycena leptocephala]|nr:S-adenosyl-L-methionine-dependent methyltransferase [Mycena leptocephala]
MEKFTYTLKTAQEVTEKHRLDEMHFVIREYLGGKISFAPIYGTSPARILELGCGSGAWAIDAANDFPDAEVIAADISPTLHGRNVKFHLLDVTQNFPFEQGTFDIVHARFLLIHVPNVKDVLERAAKLVKPGGWLILEELDIGRIIQSGGPVVSRVMAIWSQSYKPAALMQTSGGRWSR